MTRFRIAAVALALCAAVAAIAVAATAGESPKEEWIQLFNGKDLDGWTPKIRGYAAGENFGDTFRVEDGVLKVAYDKYEGKFDGRFGHLFYKDEFANYRLRLEYRFVGEQIAGGPGWAIRNSGVMFHGQKPETMRKDQEFPVSIEFQLLGGGGTGTRTTANLCTPGTNVVIGGELVTRHVTNSTSETYHGDQWVTVELEVRGKTVKHIAGGKVVLEYTDPQLDEKDADAQALLKAGAAKMLTKGTISLQSESHPVEFRKVELMKLPD
jgi:hypothetical protein